MLTGAGAPGILDSCTCLQCHMQGQCNLWFDLEDRANYKENAVAQDAASCQGMQNLAPAVIMCTELDRIIMGTQIRSAVM